MASTRFSFKRPADTVRSGVLVAILALGVAAGPLAPASMASPSVVDQYTEQIPTAGGDKDSQGTIPGGGNGPGDSGPAGNPAGTVPGDRGGLDAGLTGSATEDPGQAGKGDLPGGGEGTSEQDEASGGPSRKAGETSPVTAAADGLTSEDESGGILFPAILALCAAAIAVAVVLRRRSGFESGRGSAG